MLVLLIQTKLPTIRRTQPLFSVLVQLHVSVLIVHHQAINTIWLRKVKNALQLLVYAISEIQDIVG